MDINQLKHIVQYEEVNLILTKIQNTPIFLYNTPYSKYIWILLIINKFSSNPQVLYNVLKKTTDQLLPDHFLIDVKSGQIINTPKTIQNLHISLTTNNVFSTVLVFFTLFLSIICAVGHLYYMEKKQKSVHVWNLF
nr:hypothetical protein [Microctonus hyperodae filamentous virus]